MALRKATFSLLGTGNSTGVPWLQCVMNTAQRCTVCQNCLDDPVSKNKRNNVSAMVTVHDSSGPRHVLIDCGKTFRESAIQRFQQFNVKKLAAVILTHPHADAILGLDDLRDCSPFDRLPVYLSLDTWEVVQRSFPYLMLGPNQKPSTFVAKLDWHIIREWEPFVVGDTGLICTPLPVLHGACACFGYEFKLATDTPAAAASQHAPGADISAGTAATVTDVNAHQSSETPVSSGERLVYLSDIQSLPVDTRAYLTDRSLGPIHHLFVDALSYRRYPTHFSFKQALAMTMDIAYGNPGASRHAGPVTSSGHGVTGDEGTSSLGARAAADHTPRTPHVRNTVLIGMNHRIDYYKENAKLKAFGAAQGLSMELGYDGWSVDSQLAVCASLDTAQQQVEAGIGAQSAYNWRSIHAREPGSAQTYSSAPTFASVSSQSVESLPSLTAMPGGPGSGLGTRTGPGGGLSDSFTLADTSGMTGPLLCGDVPTALSDSRHGPCGEACAHGAGGPDRAGAPGGTQGPRASTVQAHVQAIKQVLEKGALPYDDAVIPEYDEGNTVTPPLPSQSI